MMRQLAAFVVSIMLALAGMGAAHAGLAESRAWFEGLDAEGRQGVQYDLVLLGHFPFVVDGQFGENTYEAITAFQRSQGLEETGVLDETQRQSLYDTADVIYKRFGMQSVEDAAGHSSLVIPAGLLTETTAREDGTTYADAAGTLVLETQVRAQSAVSFSELFSGAAGSGSGVAITEASFTPGRFLVTGTRDGRDFYTLFENVGRESIGFTLSWTEASAADAAILKLLVTSFFLPVEPGAPGTDKTTTAAANVFGVWSLPEADPRVIALNGEIGSTLIADFEKAVAARPDASVLVLNSPGGYVDDALVVAKMVRERQMSTLVASGMGCYSACSYIYFAGANREVDGELGVHQISAEVADLVFAQTTLADVLSALNEFGVTQRIVTVMLQTPPEEMYVFTPEEIASLGINVGGPIEVAALDEPAPASNGSPSPDPAPVAAGPQFVVLSLVATKAAAEQSLQFVKDAYGAALGKAVPEVAETAGQAGPLYAVRVAAPSAENANAICSAVKSAGGGCYVAAD